MESRAKTHPSQWTVLLDFAEENPSILTKKFDGASGRIKYNEKWTEITNTLNSMGYLQKSTEKWQNAVGDWKSKVRSKVAALKKGLNQTGGGGPLPPLNENENRLISLLGWSIITGDGNIEMGCDIEQLGNAMSLDPLNTASSSTAKITPSPPPLVFLSECSENKSNVPSTSENVEPPKKKAKTTENKKNWDILHIFRCQTQRVGSHQTCSKCIGRHSMY